MCVCVCVFSSISSIASISGSFWIVGVALGGCYGGDGDHGGRNAHGQPRGASIPHLEAVDELLECPVPGGDEDKLRGASHG